LGDDVFDGTVVLHSLPFAIIWEALYLIWAKVFWNRKNSSTSKNKINQL